MVVHRELLRSVVWVEQTERPIRTASTRPPALPGPAPWVVTGPICVLYFGANFMRKSSLYWISARLWPTYSLNVWTVECLLGHQVFVSRDRFLRDRRWKISIEGFWSLTLLYLIRTVPVPVPIFDEAAAGRSPTASLRQSLVVSCSWPGPCDIIHQQSTWTLDSAKMDLHLPDFHHIKRGFALAS